MYLTDWDAVSQHCTSDPRRVSYVVKIFKVCSVEFTIQLVWHNSLHHDVDAERVEALCNELL